jgi:zinc transport system substrate-binding protein
VIASFYPLAEAARKIGGERVRVTDLTAVGVEQAVSAAPSMVTKADLLDGLRLRDAAIGIGGMRGDRVGGGKGPGSLHGGRDPHVCADPAGFAAMARRIQRVLIAAAHGGRSTYETDGRRYLGGLRALHADFRRGLTRCRFDVLVTSHAAFGYLAARYGLKQAAIAGLSPDAEPDPRSLAASARYAQVNDVTTVFFEALVPCRISDTVAREIGARTHGMDPVERSPDASLTAETYSSIQRRNLAALRNGLRCAA